MTVQVTRQTAYVGLNPYGVGVTRQTAYVALLIAQPEVVVTRQTAYLALLREPTGRRRQLIMG